MEWRQEQRQEQRHEQRQNKFQTDQNLEISKHQSYLDTGNQAIPKFNIHNDSGSIEKRHSMTSMIKNSGNKIITDTKQHSSQKINAEQMKVANKFEKNELVKHHIFQFNRFIILLHAIKMFFIKLRYFD